MIDIENPICRSDPAVEYHQLTKYNTYNYYFFILCAYWEMLYNFSYVLTYISFSYYFIVATSVYWFVYSLTKQWVFFHFYESTIFPIKNIFVFMYQKISSMINLAVKITQRFKFASRYNANHKILFICWWMFSVFQISFNSMRMRQICHIFVATSACR